MLDRLKPYLLLTLLGLVFFADLFLHPTQVLYGEQSDLLAMHIPVKRLLVRSWQETGEVPLWNPYVFAGMPFAQDVQVAAFYPLHGPLYLLPERAIGVALSWLIVLHVLVAGWCMYAYASTQELGRAGAFVAAIGYMFAGKWMLHLLSGGHYPMIGLAWVPLLLLFLERAIGRRSVGSSIVAGLIFALIVLGSHPQVTFYIGVFIALWTLRLPLEAAGYFGGEWPRSWRRTAAAHGRWLGYGCLTAVIGVSLSAIQLLPNLEVVPHTSRSMGMPSAEGLLVAVWKITELVGPPWGEVTWENRGGFGVLWLAVAGMALLLGPRRLRFQALIWLVLVVYAIGGAVLFEGLPGFRLFRLPARVLWLAAVPLSLLAGAAIQALFAEPTPDAAVRRRCRWLLLGVLLVALAVTAFNYLSIRSLGQSTRPAAWAYWITAFLTVAAAFWLLTDALSRRPWLKQFVWIALLLTDLWVFAWPLMEVRSEAEVYTPSDAVRFLSEQQDEQVRVLDRDLPNHPGNTPLGFALPMLLEIEPVRGWHSLDINRYKEYVQFISDVDGPVGPRDLITDFPIKNKSLLDLLGVKYVLQPSDPRLLPPGEASPSALGLTKLTTDSHPQAFGVVNGRGMQRFPPYTLYENPAALPRAFIVHEAAALPEQSQILQTMKETDFRRKALLEGHGSEATMPSHTEAASHDGATITEYYPNRVAIQVKTNAPGYLVLTDLWYPGWTSRIDGVATPLYRANYVFRAVTVPAGEHEVVFRFDSTPLLWGKVISGGALLVLVAGCIVVWLRRRHSNISEARRLASRLDVSPIR